MHNIAEYTLFIVQIIFLQRIKAITIGPTARTFIHDGGTTKYVTEVIFPTPDNSRIYPQATKKSSRILYDSVTSFEADRLAEVSRLSNEITPEGLFYLNEHPPNAIDAKYSNNQNFSNFDQSSEAKSISLQRSENDSRSLKAITRQRSKVTYYGFADFTTVVGESVIIYSPSKQIASLDNNIISTTITENLDTKLSSNYSFPSEYVKAKDVEEERKPVIYQLKEMSQITFNPNEIHSVFKSDSSVVDVSVDSEDIIGLPMIDPNKADKFVNDINPSKVLSGIDSVTSTQKNVVYSDENADTLTRMMDHSSNTDVFQGDIGKYHSDLSFENNPDNDEMYTNAEKSTDTKSVQNEHDTMQNSIEFDTMNFEDILYGEQQQESVNMQPSFAMIENMNTYDSSLREFNDITKTNKKDIEIYKTLYTVYTYLTTYFHSSTSFLHSQTEVLSSILTTELVSSPTNSNIVIPNTNDIDETTLRTYSLTVNSLQFEGLQKEVEQCSTCLQFLNSRTTPEKPILLAAYTFYTTLYSGNVSQVITHSTVLGGDMTNIAPSILETNIPISSITAANVNSTIKQIALSTSDSKLPDLKDDAGNIIHFTEPIVEGRTEGVYSPTHTTNQTHLAVLVDPSATLILQTGFTTQTYFTTIYSGERTDVISHLETITTTMTETYPILKTSVNSVLPITYYTTFTFWTKLATNNEITTISREETISNVVTQTNMPNIINDLPKLENKGDTVPIISENEGIENNPTFLIHSNEKPNVQSLDFDTLLRNETDELSPTEAYTDIPPEIKHKSVNSPQNQKRSIESFETKKFDNAVLKDTSIHPTNFISSNQHSASNPRSLVISGLPQSVRLEGSVMSNQLIVSSYLQYPLLSTPLCSNSSINIDSGYKTVDGFSHKNSQSNILCMSAIPMSSMNEIVSPEGNDVRQRYRKDIDDTDYTDCDLQINNTCLQISAVESNITPDKYISISADSPEKVLLTNHVNEYENITVHYKNSLNHIRHKRNANLSTERRTVRDTTRSRFKRPRSSMDARIDLRNSDERKNYSVKMQPQQTTTPKTRSTLRSKHPDSTINNIGGSHKRLVRPSHVSSVATARSKFTLREKELTTTTEKSVMSIKRIPFRKPQSANGIKAKRPSLTSSSQLVGGKRRINNHSNNSESTPSSRNTGAHKTRSSPAGRSRTGSFRDSEARSRNRNSHESNNDVITEDKSGIITVTHIIPAETYLPVVNGKSTELRRIVTAMTSTDILSPQQYTKSLGLNGQISLVLTSDSSSVSSNGATEVIKYVLRENPTTTITFTPTTIRGRKTSFSLVLPSTAYTVDYITSTIQPQIQADTPLANILLSQLLLGNVGFPKDLLYGLYNGAPSQQAQPAQPAVEYITRTSTYVTTLIEGKSTILPITFQGKKILTTIFDTTAQTITATEFVTDTIVTTPTATSQLPMVNSLLLQQLLLQQVADPIKNVNLNSLEMPSHVQFQRDQDILPNNGILDSGRLDLTSTNGAFNDDQEEIDTFTERTKTRRNGKKHKRKHKEEQSLDDVSVITLYVSGRRPGEFSTLLSTLQPDHTVHKRELHSTLNTKSNLYLVENTSYEIENNDRNNEEATQSLKSIVGDVNQWYVAHETKI